MFQRIRFLTCSAAVALFVCAGDVGAQGAGDSVQLTLAKDLQGGAELRWSGGAPIFQVYRSASPSAVPVPDNLLVETLDPRYVDYDVPPPGAVQFYQVASASNCFRPTADTYSSSLEPGKPTGDETALEVMSGQSDGRAYLRFQLNSIPPGSTIDAATLWMEQASSAFGDSHVTLRRPQGPWAEDTLTYATEPGPVDDYGTPVQPGGSGRRSWDATALVQDWVGGGVPEFGLVLEANPNWGSAEVVYGSREGAEETVPRLCVSWTDPIAALGETSWEDSTKPPMMRFDGDRLATLEVEIPVVATDPVDAGLEFLDRYAALYDLDDPHAQLFLDRLVVDGTAWSVTFGVRRDNHRARGEQILVVYENGVVKRTSTFARPGRSGAGSVVLTPQQAEAAALAALPALQNGGTMGEPSLEWYRADLFEDHPVSSPYDEDPSRLAYRVTVHGMRNGLATHWTVHVDAESGAVLRTFFEDRTADRPDEDFRVMDVGFTESSTCWWRPLENQDTEWFDEDGVTGYPGAGADSFFDGVNASNALHDTYHYLYDTLGVRSWNDSGGQVRAMVHVGADWNNARHVGFCGQLQFGDGWAVRDVLAHEFGHGVVAHNADMVYEHEPGALDESYADWLGALVDGDWLMGEDLEAGGWGAIRDMANPPAKGDPDHVDPGVSGDGAGLRTASYAECDRDDPDYNDCAFVHSNSGIPNKVIYLVTSGGVHNGIAVGALGDDKVARLYYDTLRNRLHSSSHFMHQRDETISVARDHWLAGRHGFTASDVCQVINAFHSVGLGDPDTDCDGTPNPPTSDGDGDGTPDGLDNCPFRSNAWQTDDDGDGVGNACDDDIDGDGYVNTGDNCPRVWNDDQSDVDRDGIGDLCDDDDDDRVLDLEDNCPDTFNPYQGDLDGDGLGDVCDDDDDGDGVIDTEDNCALGFNPDQLDPDGNGIGLLCDFDERSDLDGLRIGAELDLIHMHEEIATPIRVPIFPCSDDTCPDRLPSTLDVAVGVEISPAYQVRIVDDTGQVLDQLTPDPNGSYTLNFEADHEYFYKDGLTVTTFRGRRYFLEMMAPPGSQAGMVQGLIRVESTEGQ